MLLNWVVYWYIKRREGKEEDGTIFVSFYTFPRFCSELNTLSKNYIISHTYIAITDHIILMNMIKLTDRPKRMHVFIFSNQLSTLICKTTESKSSQEKLNILSHFISDNRMSSRHIANGITSSWLTG